MKLDLHSWPSVQRRALLNMIDEASPEDYAVFDADNTIWKHDLEEALLAWLESRNILSLSNISSAILPIPPREHETIFSYYSYLSKIDHKLCYLWACQAFEGLSLELLKRETKIMLQEKLPIQCFVLENGQHVSSLVPIPKIYPAQRELINHLTSSGIDVWVVSASLEELVRFVVCDPDSGLNIAHHRVIGVNLLLHQEDQKSCGAFDRKRGFMGAKDFFSTKRLRSTYSAFPITPLTWYSGKVAGIKEWISPARRPILVAGDSPNDFYMQFYSSNIRLRIHTSELHRTRLKDEIHKRNIADPSDGNPNRGWIEVSPAELGCPD